MAGVQKKLGLKNIGGFAVSQNAGAVQVAAYVPEGKGSPGFVGVWPLAQLNKNETPPPTARRSFFRVTPPSPRKEDFNLEGRHFGNSCRRLNHCDRALTITHGNFLARWTLHKRQHC